MKKKFLSLMMAAAVVATTSVSAFADEVVKQDGGTVDVKITGTVNDESNTPPQGTISVTIPTALAFTVDNKGVVGGMSLNIKNNGTEDVEIYACQFSDGNGEDGINVVQSMTNRESEKTNKVALNLEGNAGAVRFASNGKIYDAKKLTEAVETEDGVKISTLGKLGGNNTDTIELTGTAGKNASGVTAVREQFTVKLKVKKVKKTPTAQAGDV